MRGSLQILKGAIWIHYPKDGSVWPGSVHAFVGAEKSRVTLSWSGDASQKDLYFLCGAIAKRLSLTPPLIAQVDIDDEGMRLVEPYHVSDKAEPLRFQAGLDVDHPIAVVWRNRLANDLKYPNMGVEVDRAGLSSLIDLLPIFMEYTSRRKGDAVGAGELEEILYFVQKDLTEALAPGRSAPLS